MGTMYDVLIAGAGIVGLATGLKILEKKPGAKLLILEKEKMENWLRYSRPGGFYDKRS